VTVRYWLARLLRRNLFRESDDAAKRELRQYFTNRGQEKGASLADDLQSWSPMVVLLKHHVEISEGRRPTKRRKLISALEAVMADPDLTNSQFAKRAKTTEKQIARMTDVFQIQKLWKHRHKSRA
jgi:hypothetical protein